MPIDSVQRRRRTATQEALRERAKGVYHINGIHECISMAEQAYLLGDKDSVPAIALKMRGHEIMLRKVLPDLRSVELNAGDGGEGPVLILDLVGKQPFRLEKKVPEIAADGDVVDVEVPDDAGPVVRFDDSGADETLLD